MERFFSEEFRRDHAPEVDNVRARFLTLNAEGYAGCCCAIRDMALLDRVAKITAPTLIVGGTLDVATPFEGHGAEIQKRMQQAQVRMMPAAHIAPVEMPDAFATILRDFLSGVPHA
jgi:pimeloyl-ACP methyl ester carboxylesterase